MKKIITLAFCLHLMPSLFAQHVNYETDSKWFMGLNVGAAWNTTDVKNETNVGYGFLIGRSFNYGYGKRMSFDLRLRYLRGTWYGQDYDTTDLTNYDPAFMPSQLQAYKDSPGYTVNNFQADVHELGLELALHANRMRERTGWDPYIFGGANIVWNQTNSNLLNFDSSFISGVGQYDYDPAIITESYINSQLDGTFDTPMNKGSLNGDWNADFMPSLGIGIGYYFGPRFSVGIEHKTTFALKDDWDGFENPEERWGMFENDIYHYTSGYLRFHFRTGRGHVETPNDPDPVVGGIAPCNKPVVKYIRPSSNGVEVADQIYALRAKITNVSGRGNIVVRVNGTETTNFFYDVNTDQLEGNLVLVEGLNNIQIVASNGCGSDVEDITINYVTCKDPIVNFINPSHNNFNVDEPAYVVSASVAHGGSIAYTINGVASSNFYFNQANGSFESTVTLRKGSNTISITATNDCGTDTETINIILTDCEDPNIAFLIGNGSTMSTDQPSSIIKAHVYGVAQKNAIGFRVNGMNKPFTFNPATHLLENSVTLSPGQNIIQITSGNDCGTATETITIYYNPCIDPTVSIITPTTSSSSNTTGTVLVKSSVTNISSASQIQMYVNGVAISGGTYAHSTHLFTQNAPLNTGLNTIQVVVTNDCGRDTETITVNYSAPCPKPIVSGISNITQVNSPNLPLQVMIQNITAVSQVNVTVNGVQVNGGSYSANTHVFQSNIVLQEGSNTIVVTAMNDCGSDYLTLVVNYQAPCDLPVITMINPMSQPLQSATPNLVVQASIANITSGTQVTMTVNGVVDGNGTYNNTTHVYQNGVKLQTGENVIVITATNPCGTVTQTILVSYSPCLEPLISITAPSSLTTQNGTTIVQASVQNVSSASQIQLLVNGASVSGSYSSITGIFQSNVALQQGANVIQIIATNDCGTDSEMKTITFQPCLDPVINIIAPTTMVTQSSSLSVQASVLNITSGNQVQLTVNGVNVGGSYNGTTHIYSANVTLQNGSNVISMTVTNSCGSATKTIAIRYDEPCDAPVISIITPVAGTLISGSTVQLQATVTNVTSANQITATVNGQSVSGGSYSSVTHIYQATVSLQTGSNMIVISATNSCGSDSKSVIVNNKPVNEQKMMICHHPPGNPTNTQQLEIPVSAWAAHQAHGDTQGDCPPPVVEEKMMICHHPPGNPSNTQQLEIPVSAWAAHQAHGDTQGDCPPVVEEKMMICHHPPGNPSNTQQLEIPISAWAAHQAHGDTQGDCPPPVVEQTMVICHHPRLNSGVTEQITIPVSEWATHQTHGDTQGPCPDEPVVEEKMMICHHPPGNPSNTQQLEIPVSAWAAHQAHGDTQGDCPPPVEVKMTICHHPPGNPSNTQELEISISAWAAHQAHGDTEGPCPDVPVVEEKMMICHHPPGNPENTQEIQIPLSAWAAHEAHGDVLGPCQDSGLDLNGGGGTQGSSGSGGGSGGTTIGIAPGGGSGGILPGGGIGNGNGTSGSGGGNSGGSGQSGGNAGNGENSGGNGGGNKTSQEDDEEKEAARVKAEQEAKAKAAADAKRKAEEVAKQKAAQIEAARKAKEAAKLKAEKDAKAKADADAKGKAQEEAARKAKEAAKLKAEQEAKAKADAEVKRKAEEAAKQKAAQEEAVRKTKEAARVKAEQEAKADADAKRKAQEVAKQKAAQEEAARKAKEAARVKAEQETKAKADAKRKAEEVAKQKAAQEEAAQKAKEAARVKAEQEVKAKADADIKKKAEESAKLKAAEQAKAKEATKKKAEEDAKKKAEEEKVKPEGGSERGGGK